MSDGTGQPHKAPRGDLSAFGRPGGRLGRLGAPPAVVRPVVAPSVPAVPAVEPVVSGAQTKTQVLEVPWAEVAQNPLNDRASYEDLSNLESIRERQINPCVVVTRAVFLTLFPADGSSADQAAAQAIGECRYVVVAGSRRRAAVERFGVELLRIDVIDGDIASRADFLTETIRENNYTPLNPVEEARALERLVVELGSPTEAGHRLSMSRTVVSQRRAILKFCPQMQDLVIAGEIPVRVARSLAPKVAHLPAEEQLAAWRQHQREQLSAVKASDREQDQDQEAAPVKPRRWVITEKQTPMDVAVFLRERFTADERRALIVALQET